MPRQAGGARCDAQRRRGNPRAGGVLLGRRIDALVEKAPSLLQLDFEFLLPAETGAVLRRQAARESSGIQGTTVRQPRRRLASGQRGSNQAHDHGQLHRAAPRQVDEVGDRIEHRQYPRGCQQEPAADPPSDVLVLPDVEHIPSRDGEGREAEEREGRREAAREERQHVGRRLRRGSQEGIDDVSGGPARIERGTLPRMILHLEEGPRDGIRRKAVSLQGTDLAVRNVVEASLGRARGFQCTVILSFG
mmetsp:Transcript_14123/g.38822  ORF Transcript_14123/g.38822 Transcript_14123/m.38822 type:complete len:248 (-) Transcript_14123:448-1191(-)